MFEDDFSLNYQALMRYPSLIFNKHLTKSQIPTFKKIGPPKNGRPKIFITPTLKNYSVVDTSSCGNSCVPNIGARGASGANLSPKLLPSYQRGSTSALAISSMIR